MNTPLVIVDGCKGVIFEGELPATYCFVPQECLSIDAGGIQVNEIEYVCRGWHARNIRFSERSDGQYLFPKPFFPVSNLEAESVTHFLDRIKKVHCV
jgi:hypothetical protein